MATLHAKIREIQRINQRELEQGTPDRASWHTQYKKSAYIYVGNLPFELNEGDVIQMFSQWGEIVDCNLIRDNPKKGGGKSRGFAFVAYEDQRSTVLAVDNFNGTNLHGRDLHVDHVLRYRKPQNLQKDTAGGGVGDVEEDDETYENRRKMIWDYTKYRNCRPPHGIKEEIVARNEGQRKLKEKKNDLQRQIEERRERRQKQRREHGERFAFNRKPDQKAQEDINEPVKLTFDEEIRLMARKTKKEKRKRQDGSKNGKSKKKKKKRRD